MIGNFLAWLQDSLRAEPVLVLALVQSAIAMFVAFGLNWTGEQVGAVVAFSAAVLGVVARQRVQPL